MAIGTEIMTSRQVVANTPAFTDTRCEFIGGTSQVVGTAHTVTALGKIITPGYYYAPHGAPDGQAREIAVYRAWTAIA